MPPALIINALTNSHQTIANFEELKFDIEYEEEEGEIDCYELQRELNKLIANDIIEIDAGYYQLTDYWHSLDQHQKEWALI